MKLLDILTKFLPKKPEQKEVIVSILLDVDSVSAAAWTAEKKGRPSIIRSATREVSSDTWDDRIKATDSAVSLLDETVGATKIQNVVLGLPPTYLTESGDIEKSVRKEIKRLTDELDLTPVGFVTTYQAIAHTLKRDEGVPPTVILLGVQNKTLTITLYKVGTFIGQKVTQRNDEVASGVEKVLKGFADIEILPSRMLLYGSDRKLLEEVQAKLLRHPWQTRVNFLHFPKIELLPVDYTVAAISLAGATELFQGLGEDEEVASSSVSEYKDAEVPVAETADKELSESEIQVSAREHGSVDKRDRDEVIVEGTPQSQIPGDEEPNVVMVAPEELGFQKEDIREVPIAEEEYDAKQETHKERKKLSLPVVTFPVLPKISLRLPKVPGLGIVVIGGAVVLLLLFELANWVLPKAAVTVLAIPQVVEDWAVVSVESTSTVVDASNKIIPGKKQEKTASGEKVIPVTGKKKVGDPAKGSVVLFNKSMTGKTFKKGSILVSNNLQFTLDDDVQVASASENLVSGTVTFGKGTASVTAVDIGTQSNLPSATEFTFKEVLPSVAIARSEKAFTGGTSRDVTVVSRADYDVLTKILTQELVENAKKELAGSVAGGEKLIDATVKTSVTEKTFTEELDQEATQLHGKLTIAITGISYSEEDITSMLRTLVTDKVIQGYTLDETSVKASIANAQLKKDGTITITASLKGSSLPVLDGEKIKQAIAGKKLTEAQVYLRQIPGVAGAEFRFRYAFSKDKLPSNKNNISVSIAVQE